MIKHCRYKAVIFDFDDTLVKSRQAKWDHHIAVTKKFYNYDLKEETIALHWGKPFPKLLEALYGHLDSVENVIENIYKLITEFPKTLYPETKDVIEKLLNQNIELGIVSSADTKFILEDLRRLDFPVERFISILGSDLTEFHKPDGKVFLSIFEILKNKNIEKSEIIYVGDSVDDLKAAQSAGIDFIAVTTGLYDEKTFLKNGATKITNSIGGILEKIF